MPDKQLLAALHEQPKIAQLKADLAAFFAPISSSDEAEPFNDVAEMPVAVTRITRSECMKGFRILELDWQRDTVYFIKDNSGDEKYLYLIKYRALGAVDQDTAGAFWVERLTEAL